MKIPEQKIDNLKRALSRLILFALIVLTLLAVFGNHAVTVAAQAEPTAQPGSPILVSTPREDGSIVHVVQPGQTLIGIATAYDISLADLLALNGMNENSFIYVDEELIIRGPYTPTPTALPTETPTPLPPTPRPTRTPRPATPTHSALTGEVSGGSPTPTTANLGAAAVAQMQEETDRETLVLGVIAVAFVFLVAPLAVALIRRK